MDEPIHWPKRYLLFASNLWWNIVIEIWTEKHLVSDSDRNTVNL